RAQGGILAVVSTFGRLMKDPVFMGIALTPAFISSSMFAYIAGSPFVLQNLYHVTPQQFSLFFVLNRLGIIIAVQITARLANKYQLIQLFLVWILISFSGCILLLIVMWQQLSLRILAIALLLVVSSLGMVSTTAFSLVM